jgi:hexulose-6-phosphate isomerase
MRFGIMQGRLSPAPAGRPQAFPWATWRAEFADARTAGFEAIEWLVTAERRDENPLLTGPGAASIRLLARDTGVRVASVCADCFIALPLVGASGTQRDDRSGLLAHIVRQAALIDARTVVLPLLEGNAPADEAEAAALLRAIDPVLPHARAVGVGLALETSWPAARLLNLMAAPRSPSLGVCYDIGNAVAFGLAAAADVLALGALVRHVHVKDRRRTGESVALGEGDADLAGAFRALDAIGFRGLAILETPVGDDPLGQASRNLVAARARAAGLVPTA